MVRHGESAWNAERRLQGQADAPLSELGRAQAVELQAVLAALPVDGTVASDLSRARDTGELAALPGAELDERWRERGLGVWEGHLEAEVPAEDLRGFRREAYVPPGGESWDAFQGRVGAAVDELGERGGSWLVYTHGGCIRAAVCHVTGAEPRAVAGPANASVTVLELAPRRRLLAFNWAAQPGIPPASEPGGAGIGVSAPTREV